MTADENCAVGVAACCFHRTRCCSARNWSHPWPPSRRRSAPVSLAMHFVVSYLWLSPSRNWNGRTDKKKGNRLDTDVCGKLALLVNVRISLRLNRILFKKNVLNLVLGRSRDLDKSFFSSRVYYKAEIQYQRRSFSVYTFGNREIAWHSSLRSFTQV